MWGVTAMPPTAGIALGSPRSTPVGMFPFSATLTASSPPDNASASLLRNVPSASPNIIGTSIDTGKFAKVFSDVTAPQGGGSLQMPQWPTLLGASTGEQAGTSSSSSIDLQIGDRVEIWSNSQGTWCKGKVDRTEGGLVSVLYIALDGHQICKVMKKGDPSVRLVERGKAQKSATASTSHDFISSDFHRSSGSTCQISAPRHHAKPLKSVDLEETARILETLRRHQDNRECADCGAARPDWASIQDGTIVCLDCAGVHHLLSKAVKSMAKPEVWKASEAATFAGLGGNIQANRRLASKAGLAAPRPPPDTDRSFVERYIVRKYGGTTFFDHWNCKEASQELVRELAAEVERQRIEREKAEIEARLAAERQRREFEEKKRAAREAAELAEKIRQQQAVERAQREAEMLKQAEHEVQERAAASNAALAARSAAANAAARNSGALPVGGFRDALPASLSLPRQASGLLNGNDPGSSSPGLVVVDIVSVNLFKERVMDLRYMGAWFLDLSVTLSLGRVSTVPTASRKRSASARWDPPEQREIRWDCKQRWLWCRVNDNLAGGSQQLAGIGVIDVRAAEAEAEDTGTGVRAAEMEVELLAREPTADAKIEDLLFFTACQARPAILPDADDPDGITGRKGSAKCWQVPAGKYGPPGPPGAHGHYMFEQVEDLDHLMHGQTCGTAILRLTVLDPSASQSQAGAISGGYVV